MKPENNSTQRCPWCGKDPLYQQYHDLEWGKPVKDDQKLFEFLVLESAQAGLSWITILRKRENYRRCFSNFDPKKVASYTETDIQRLLKDSGIIRNRAKITSAIKNAQVFLKIQEEYGSFYNYLYQFLPQKRPITNHFRSYQEAPAKTDLSVKISMDLKKRGIRFFGPITCYAFMQAVGMVNDHELSCSFRNA